MKHVDRPTCGEQCAVVQVRNLLAENAVVDRQRDQVAKRCRRIWAIMGVTKEATRCSRYWPKYRNLRMIAFFRHASKSGGDLGRSAHPTWGMSPFWSRFKQDRTKCCRGKMADVPNAGKPPVDRPRVLAGC